MPPSLITLQASFKNPSSFKLLFLSLITFYRMLTSLTVSRNSQKANGLEKKDLWYPFSNQAAMTSIRSIWDYWWHCLLFPSNVVCSAEQDSYPPGVALTKMVGDYGAHGLSSLKAPWATSLPDGSPSATQSLFVNRKHRLCEVSSPEDPYMIPLCLQGEGKCLGLLCHLSPINLCFPSQTFPCSPPGLLTASGMHCCIGPVWPTFPFPTPAPESPMYFILIFLKKAEFQ